MSVHLLYNHRTYISYKRGRVVHFVFIFSRWVFFRVVVGVVFDI